MLKKFDLICFDCGKDFKGNKLSMKNERHGCHRCGTCKLVIHNKHKRLINKNTNDDKKFSLAATPVKSKSVLWAKYRNMHQVCYNEIHASYKSTGALGIAVCPAWVQTNPEGYTNFVNWCSDKYTPGAKLLRKDTSLDFSPSNCYFSISY